MVLVRFRYHWLKRAEKGVIRHYIEKVRRELLAPRYNLEKLETIANQMSDNEFAERMVKARSNLFQQISRFVNRVA